LHAHGRVVKLHSPLFRYSVRQGGHFDYFLDRAALRADGGLEFRRFSDEELDGSLAEATRQYQEAVRERAAGHALGELRPALEAGADFHRLAARFEGVEGFLDPLEGFALYWLARRWPAEGRAVEVGSFKGRSTCWLAQGCREGDRGKVAAVDH